MTIEIKKNEQETIIEIVGRLDTITAPALDKTIREDIGDTKNLVLDFKDIEYISSAQGIFASSSAVYMPSAG